MDKYGFRNIRTGFAVVDLTPDNPKFTAAMAHDMINAARQNALDGIENVLHTMPGYVTAQEAEEMKRFTNAKYDIRIGQYDRGEKQ